MVSRSLVIVTCLIIVACDDRPPETNGDLTIAVDSSGSARRVTSSGVAPTWSLQLVASIGPTSLDETGSPQEFGRAVSVALGPEDEVFVADVISNEIRVFGLDGSYRRSFGRDGEGPGEFSSLYSVAWVGDRLLALDYGNGRVGEFSRGGEWLGQRPAPARLTGSPAQLRLYPVGPNEAYAFSIAFHDGGSSVGFVGHDQDSAIDTVPALEDDAPGSVVCEHSGGVISFFDVPYGSKLLQHPGPGGLLYFTRTGEYRIVAVDSAGDTVLVVDRDLPPEPVTREEWDEGLTDFRTFLEETPSAACEPRRPDKPDFKPFIRDLLLDSRGWLWVEVVRTAGDRWELFDETGRLVAQLPVEPRKERAAPALGPDHVVFIRQDSLDLDHVDIFRIVRGPALDSS